MCANKTVVECAKLRLLVTPASIHPTNGADTIYRPLQRMFKHDSLSRTLIFHQSKSWSPQIPFQNYIVVHTTYLTGYAIRTTLRLSKAPKLMGKSWSLFVDTSPVLSGSQLLPNILPWNLCKFFFFFYQVQLHKWPRKLQLRRWTESRKSEIGDTTVQRWYYRL